MKDCAQTVVSQPGRKPEWQWYRTVLLTCGVLILTYVALVAFGMQHRGERLTTPGFWALQFWAAMVFGGFLLFAAFKLKRSIALNVIVLLFSVALLEMGLQLCGWMGWLPGVFSTKPKCPFGRVYFTVEGFGNSLRNRHGWYAEEFNLAAPHKIALIGDSFVEALEVHRSRTHGAVLQKHLRDAQRPDAILPLGTYGTSPAQHLATMEYALKHFRPQEIVLFLYAGNDVSDSSPQLNHLPPGHFFYYSDDPVNGLTLSPEDVQTRARFLRQLEFSHQSWRATSAETLASHCMILQTALSVKDGVRGMTRRHPPQATAVAHDDPTGEPVRRLGLNPRAFTTSAEVAAATETMLLALRASEDLCRSNALPLRVVTLPFFPPAFYEQPSGTNWTLQLGRYDFAAPQRHIAEHCRTRAVPFLDFTEYLRAEGFTPEAIRALYFVNGSGHFNERGHELCARAVFQTFYTREPSTPAPQHSRR